MSFMPQMSPPSTGLIPEQQNALAEFSYRQHLRILAYAGAGKSHTAAAIAHWAASQRLTGYYLCFNVSARVSMERRLPPGVIAKTTGQMANAHARGRGYSGNQLAPEQTYRSRFDLKAPAGSVQPSFALSLVIDETLKRFYRSVDVMPGPQHVPYLKTFLPGRDLTPGEANEMHGYAWQWAAWVWGHQLLPHTATPMGGAALEKLWSLQCVGLGCGSASTDDPTAASHQHLQIPRRRSQTQLQNLSEHKH